MLKRTTKITSLLVAAASIVSMVPAVAADAAKESNTSTASDSAKDSITDTLLSTSPTKVEAKEGTIYSAKEIEQGVYCVDAELNDEEEAIYIWKNGEFTKLKDADPDGKIDGQYVYEGVKYIRFEDGDCINETTGEKYDGGDVKELVFDDFGTALRKKIKKDNDGRFADSNFTGNAIVPIKDIGLGNVFYYTLKKAKVNGDTKSAIYTDTAGNYIDADYNLGKVGVVTTGASIEINGENVSLESTVTNIKNTEDTYKIKGRVGGVDKTYVLKAAITTDTPQVGAPDGDPHDWHNGTMVDNYTKSGVIRTAKLSIWIKESTANDSAYENITDKIDFGSKSNHHSVPINDVGAAMYTPVQQKIVREQASDDIDGIKYSKDASTYFETKSDGERYASNEILTIGSAFLNYDYGYGTFKAQSMDLKSENGYNYVDLGDVDEVDLVNGDYDAVDWDGWSGYGCISDGYYKLFNTYTGKFEKKYKVDGSMNRADSTMITDLIVWSTKDKVYSITTNPASAQANATAATTTSAAVKVGWSKNTDGTWSNLKADGTKVTGWLKDGTVWYYLKTDGIMATGWQNVDGTWYYLNASGAMLANTTIDGYALDANGAWVK
ncbi:N-acetylmuramoyl-L-alanine amidase family protein [Clostridium diolis]|uniref:N-acetylmuramoyl-L-alanine amidase family protein n=1 Tax=Clostridium diolis TaxID=223919 RepID=UPI003AF9E7B6